MKTLHLVTPHATGPEVTHLQTLLKAHGWYHAAIDGEYGPYTAQAVYRAKFWLGYAHPDQIAGARLFGLLEGKINPTTKMAALAHKRQQAKPKPAAKTKGDALVAYEMTQVGTKENPAGSNDTKYGAWYGANGLPWCAMFQSYSADKVGLRFHYAYVPAVVADARAGKNGLSLLHSSQLFPGALVCYDWPGESPGTADHIGCFVKWVKQGVQFQAVEGNTGSSDRSNGGEVLAPTDRYVSEVQAFVKITGVLQPAS